MTQPTPTPIAPNAHLITITATHDDNNNVYAYEVVTQVDVRTVQSWSYEYLPSFAGTTGPLWIVKAYVSNRVTPYKFPMLGAAGTGWNATKTASLAGGG